MTRSRGIGKGGIYKGKTDPRYGPLFVIEPRGYVTPCWVWQRCTNGNGYGQWKNPKYATSVAHRIMFEMANGPVPKGSDLDHLCRNRICVRPDHLEVVTRKENARRGLGTKLTRAQVLEIRQLRAQGVRVKVVAASYEVSHGTIVKCCVEGYRGED